MDPSLNRYAENLRRKEAAESYSTKYERHWHKRVSDATERRVIARALAQTSGPYERILDMPCGAGRLLSEFLHLGAEVHACDYSEKQMEICAKRYESIPLKMQRVDALALPFEDDFFDLVYSGRLSHHIGEVKDREKYLRELLRVSRRYVIASFFGFDSLKNRLRRLRTHLGLLKKRPKFTMSRDQLDDIAKDAGWTIKASIPLSRLFSGHDFVVFEKQG